MGTWYVTFGQQYPREPHPVLEVAHRDGWVEIEAPTWEEARARTTIELGSAWSAMYEDDDFDRSYYPLGCLARFD